MRIDKSAIRRLIPHAGAMCLIDRVHAWDSSHIDCASDSHRDPENPLRSGGHLPALHAFEYGAQAAAIHGGLMAVRAGRGVPRAWLGAIRHGYLDVDRLDTIATTLEISAEVLLSDEGNVIYRCRIAAGGAPVADARITIMRRNG